jgi:predicted peroxiredoxin
VRGDAERGGAREHYFITQEVRQGDRAGFDVSFFFAIDGAFVVRVEVDDGKKRGKRGAPEL